MMKLFKYILITTLFTYTGFAHAADMTLTCENQGPCNMLPHSGATLFDESNWLPGDTVAKTIQATNNDENDSCNLKVDIKNETQSPASFTSKLFTSIHEGGSPLYGNLVTNTYAGSSKTLANLISDGLVSLGVMTPNGGTNIYTWVITFDPATGNEYQNAQTMFDFDLVFTCDHDEGDGDDEKEEDEEEEDEGEEGTVAGISTFAPLLEVPVVAGTSIEPEEEPLVEGIEDVFEGIAKCIDPWWWWLVFGLQILVHLVVRMFVGAKHSTKYVRFYLMQILVGAVFFYVFWIYFCPWWDKWVSLLIGLVMLYMTHRKLKSNEDEKDLSNSPGVVADRAY
jgi:uncharacterized membrane protein